MQTFYKKYKRDEFSQNGEDGLLEEILGRMGIDKGTVVEFGAHNGMYCSNSRALILKGWSAFLIEQDKDLYRQLVGLYRKPSHLQFGQPAQVIPNVTLLDAMVTPDNVNSLLPRQMDVLSIDVDGIDYNIWKAYEGDAKVVIIEINSSLDPFVPLAGDPQRGSSYFTMVSLAMAKGYMLICHCGNLIFVKEEYADLFPEIPGGSAPLRQVTEFFNRSWLPASTNA